MPAEQDGAIQAGANEGGFWYPGETTKPVSELVNEYEDSVGHNSNFMLELSPDRNGAVPESDLAAYTGMGKVLSDCYALTAAVAITNGTFTSSNNTSMTMTLTAGGVDRILIKEDVAHFGQQIRSYTISTMAPASTSPSNSKLGAAATAAGEDLWTPLASGLSVGHARIHRLPSPLAKWTQLKLDLLEVASWPPVIRTFAAFAQSTCISNLK